MFKNNKNLFVIAVIALVNALGYGIIIPILYSYSHKFGLSDFQNGLLFSIFSVCQFLATPLIGRLSDKYGRKPLLLISLTGTALSFLMMAFAPSAIFLFLARALDGITAGNIPVASAVISDTTEPKDRAKGFGIISAAFGFGFIFGPAISALTLGFGASVPFIIAAVVSVIAIIMTWVILPETNKHVGEVKHGKLIDIPKLLSALIDENVGTTLLVSLLYTFAFSLFIYAFQPFSVKILHITAQQISINFTIFGVIGLIAQGFIIPKVTKKFGEKRALSYSLILAVFTFLGLFVSRTYLIFTFISIFHALANGFVNPLVQTLLSKEADAKSQGSILGLNASYVSIGMIFGPIVGGALASYFIPLPFLLGSIVAGFCVYLSFQILLKPHAKQTAF